MNLNKFLRDHHMSLIDFRRARVSLRELDEAITTYQEQRAITQKMIVELENLGFTIRGFRRIYCELLSASEFLKQFLTARTKDPFQSHEPVTIQDQVKEMIRVVIEYDARNPQFQHRFAANLRVNRFHLPQSRSEELKLIDEQGHQTNLELKAC